MNKELAEKVKNTTETLDNLKKAFKEDGSLWNNIDYIKEMILLEREVKKLNQKWDEIWTHANREVKIEDAFDDEDHKEYHEESEQEEWAKDDYASRAKEFNSSGWRY